MGDRGVEDKRDGRVPQAAPGSREPSQQAVSAASGFDPSREWIAYDERRPETEGVYEWRVPSVAVPGIVVRVLDHMRERGAGYSRVLSPSFDYWDGYRVHVPKGTEWRPTAEGADLKSYQNRLLGVEGVEFEPCPFCKRVPTLKALIGGWGNGVAVSDDPHRYDNWRLECCAWVTSPRFRDPRELRDKRASLLASDSDGSGEAGETPKSGSTRRATARAEGIAQPSRSREP